MAGDDTDDTHGQRLDWDEEQANRHEADEQWHRATGLDGDDEGGWADNHGKGKGTGGSYCTFECFVIC
jgi:hypothetical protein